MVKFISQRDSQFGAPAELAQGSSFFIRTFKLHFPNSPILRPSMLISESRSAAARAKDQRGSNREVEVRRHSAHRLLECEPVVRATAAWGTLGIAGYTWMLPAASLLSNAREVHTERGRAEANRTASGTRAKIEPIQACGLLSPISRLCDPLTDLPTTAQTNLRLPPHPHGTRSLFRVGSSQEKAPPICTQRACTT